MRRRAMLSLDLMRCAAVVVVCLLSLARSADARSVGVVVTGEEIMQSPLRAQLELWLRGHGHEPVASPFEPNAINQLVDCFVIEDKACAQKVVEQHAKADAILYARIEVVSNGTSRDVIMTMHWFLKGKDPTAERKVCSGCSDDAMRQAADEMITALVPVEAVKIVAPPPPVRIVVVAPRASRMGPAIAVGTGVAALIAGGVLYATSETDDGSKPTYRDTKPLGIGLAIGGAVAIGIGVVLMLREGPAREPSGPAVAITPHGGFIGWTSRF
jgi:hypothetical protein